MKNYVLLIILIGYMTNVCAVPINPAECHDWAAFAYYAADARDRGIPAIVYRNHLIDILKRPELADKMADIGYALALVDMVYRSPLPPQAAFNRAFSICSNGKQT